MTVEVTAYQNEELQRTLIPNALRSGDAPDLFQQWGAGELAAQVEAGYVMDISDQVGEELELIGATVAPWQVDGKTYGLPFSFGIEGFWYNKDEWATAGVTEAPTTSTNWWMPWARSGRAASRRSRWAPAIAGPPPTTGTTSRWKACSPDVLQQAQIDLKFDDPCWVDAGEMLQEFIDINPFQEGYLATPAQQGAGKLRRSARQRAGIVRTDGPLEPRRDERADSGRRRTLLPRLVQLPGHPGTPGDPTAALGGGDGFSCSATAPPECVELLKYISSVDVQTRFAETGAGLPVTRGAESGVSDPNLLLVLEGRNSASYVQLWLDTAYGTTVGGAMNDAIVNLFADQGTPAGHRGCDERGSGDPVVTAAT